MFITYSKHCLYLCLLSYTCGCSPFLDDPAPYPPDPNLQDQMLVDSTLRFDQYVPPPSSPPSMNNQIDSLNIHATRLIPSLVDSTITALNNANVKYDIMEISR